MARSGEKARRRREQLLRTLQGWREVSTIAMARRLGVSPMTIRRDLAAIQASGAAVRCYGGAVAARRITFEFAFDRRHRRNLAAKRRIGQAAAARIRPGQVVFLDTGTTTLEAARALAARGVACTAVTSSLVVASELWGRAGIELHLVGGRVRGASPDLVGPQTELLLDRLTADIALVGSDGIDPARGSFSADAESAGVAERMCRNARRAVVVADASKLGVAGAVRYLPIDKMTELITDRSADRRQVAAMRGRGVRVEVV
ncbi:MAG: Glucitol operon repressor [Phycisphaerae bacterium]|nr:Glucitol operon repressor [Phycisphaerae bacterium]